MIIFIVKCMIIIIVIVKKCYFDFLLHYKNCFNVAFRGSAFVNSCDFFIT